MSFRALLAAAAIVLCPVSAASAATPKKAAPASSARKSVTVPKPDMDPMMAFAMMNRMMDKLFPTGPEPEPARLAAARDMTMRMFPKGAYAGAMTNFANTMADRVLAMSEADLADIMPDEAKKGDKPKTPPSTLSLRQTMTAKDPTFDAKVAAGKAFAGVFFTKFGDVMEPRFREGMARSMARKFDARQLAEINAFLATPTGAAYGQQMIGMWFEPDVIRGTMQAFPEMLKMMPDMAKDMEALGKQMAPAEKAPAKTH